jgi:DDE family transposase
MGMANRLQSIPTYLLTLVETLRSRLRDPNFLDRHRIRKEDFTRQRQLTFPVVMLFILQKTVKSIQRHLHEFLDELACGELFEPVTAGAWTHARAKLKHTAFMELNRDCVLPMVYAPERAERVILWRGHRLLGVDSSLLRLPNHPELSQEFSCVEVRNQLGATGTGYPEGRLSVLYDLRNGIGLDARLEPSTLGEVDLAIDQLASVQPGDVLINDRGFTGYEYLAQVHQRGAHFIGRCSLGSFAGAQDLFRLQRAGQSRVVRLLAPAAQKAHLRQLGLPLEMVVRFVSLRLPTGELEVLVTSLLDEEAYPTEEFLMVYHWRWGHETYHLMLKSRLDLENFSGQTPEAVRQDVHAAVLLCNLERVLSEPAQSELAEKTSERQQAVQVNRAVAYHALKDQVLPLLYGDLPAETVIRKLQQLFVGTPVAVRPDRKVPRRRLSLYRSYHYQRRVKKTVF